MLGAAVTLGGGCCVVRLRDERRGDIDPAKNNGRRQTIQSRKLS
jgi:hypothetical protein